MGLISCVPHIVANLTEERHDLTEIPGIVPGISEFGQDCCLYASRCPKVTNQCRSARPPENPFPNDQIAACWHAEEM